MFDGGHNRQMFPVFQDFGRTELDTTGYRQKKSYLVDEHDVNTQCHISVSVHYRAWHVLSFDHNVFLPRCTWFPLNDCTLVANISSAAMISSVVMGQFFNRFSFTMCRKSFVDLWPMVFCSHA